MTRQDITGVPPKRGSGFRLVFAVAAVLGTGLYVEYLSYGLPAPSEASEPGETRAVAPMFQARLPPEAEAHPVDPTAADPGMRDAEFRDAPAVIEPADFEPNEPATADTHKPSLPDRKSVV